MRHKHTHTHTLKRHETERKIMMITETNTMINPVHETTLHEKEIKNKTHTQKNKIHQEFQMFPAMTKEPTDFHLESFFQKNSFIFPRFLPLSDRTSSNDYTLFLLTYGFNVNDEINNY